MLKKKVHRTAMIHQRITGSSSQEEGTACVASQNYEESSQNHAEKKPTTSFLYNKHVLPAAIPGLLFIFTMAGELLLTILTIGALVIYLMVSGGSQQNAVVSYICTFVAAQMAVLYSCLPLIWISFLNIPLLMLVNMFLGMTGGWGLVQFPFFIQEQPILAQTIETGLFSLYPLVSIGLVTWISAYLTSIRFALFVAVLYGFLLLRIYLKPTTSSFYVLNQGLRQRTQILGSPETATVIIVYLGFPVLLYLASHIMSLIQGDSLAFIELLLFLLLPCFLTTLIQLRAIYEQFNITVTQVSHVRIALGFAALILSCWIVHGLGISSAIPWLFPVILFYTLLGISLSKGRKFIFMSRLLTLATVLIIAYAVIQVIPSSLDVPSVSLHTLTLLLILNAATSVLSVLLARTKKYSTHFTQSIVLQTALLVHSECFLLTRGFHMPYLGVTTFFLQAYMLARLHSSSKVTSLCLGLACSVHSMKLPFFFQYAFRLSENETHFGFLSSYSCFIFIVITLKILVYEDQRELPIGRLTGYLVCAAISFILFILYVIKPVMLQFVDHVDILAIFLSDSLVTSAFSCKLAWCNMTQKPNGLKVSVVMLFLSGFSFLIQAPIIQEHMSLWSMIMVEIAAVLLLASSWSLIQPLHPRLYALVEGILLGVPMGVAACEVFEPSDGILSAVAYAAVCVEALIIIILLWQYSTDWKDRSLTSCVKDYFLHGTVTAFLMTTMSIFLKDLLDLTKLSWWDALHKVPAVPFLCTVHLIIAVTIRIFCLKWQQNNPFSYKPGLIPTYGNLLTITTYVLLILSSPLPFPEIWNSVTSIVLLCLQQDLAMFPNFRPLMRTGIIFATCMSHFLLFSFKYSLLWIDFEIGVFAILEVLVLPFSIPPLVVMATTLSQPIDYKVPEKTVILCTPLPVLIFTFGNSYASWVLAGISFGSGVWLLQKTSFGMQ